MALRYVSIGETNSADDLKGVSKFSFNMTLQDPLNQFSDSEKAAYRRSIDAYLDDLKNSDGTSVEAVDMEWVQRGRRYFLCYDDSETQSRLVGVAGYDDCNDGGIEGPHIREVTVDPEYMRRGIGGELLRMVEVYAQSIGVEELQAAASVGAVPFFRKHGYTLKEAFKYPDHYNAGDTIQEFRMVKSLRVDKSTDDPAHRVKDVKAVEWVDARTCAVRD